MAKFFGKQYTRNEILQKVGDVNQLASIRPVVLDDGPERGVRALFVSTACGLTLTILPDRGMDILDARFNGMPFGWQSAAGPAAPTFYDSFDDEWLRTFAGGVLTTCGLLNTGPASESEFEALGMHGRISHTPARNVSFGGKWQNDDYFLWATGDLIETKVMGYHLKLQRTYTFAADLPLIQIQDEIENLGFEPIAPMLLYHCNFGFPLLDEGTELLTVAENVQPRDKAAAHGLDDFERMPAPQPGIEEQVFFIEPDTGATDQDQVGLVNREFMQNQGFGVYIRYLQSSLPYLTVWKMPRPGTYVMGLEPGNCLPIGREACEKKGMLQPLAPGDRRTFQLEIGVLADNNEIRAFEAELRG